MPKCQFTTEYYDYEINDYIHFCCPEKPLDSGFCIFHDKDYLQDKTSNSEDHKSKVMDRLKQIVNHAISNNARLLCIGFQLPDFSLSDLSNNKEFTIPVYFSSSQFFGKTDFHEAKFEEITSFSGVNFKERADFSDANFKVANFSKANFKDKADFIRANFKVASFIRAKFEKEADFYKANFEGESFFTVAKFEGEAEFSGVNFKERADFSDANFKVADFHGATFEGALFFDYAKFEGEARFFNVYFEYTHFYNSEFYGKTYFSGEFNGKTNFDYVLFVGKEKIYFDIENLSNVSFMNTDLTGVRFSDVARWGETKVEYGKFWRRKKVKEDRFKIIDERLLENGWYKDIPI